LVGHVERIIAVKTPNTEGKAKIRKYDIKMGFWELDYEDMDWTKQTVDGVQCRSLVLGKGKDAPLFFIN